MRNAVSHSVIAGGRAVALRWRALSIALRRGMWRATRPWARVTDRGRDDDATSTPRDGRRGTGAAPLVAATHRRHGPRHPWVFASALGFAGIAVLALLHLFDAGDAPKPESLAVADPDAVQNAAPPAAPIPAASWSAPWDHPDDHEDGHHDHDHHGHAPADAHRDPRLVQIDRPLSESDPPPRALEPLAEPAELSLDVAIAAPVPPAPTDSVADAPARFFVTSAGSVDEPPPASEAVHQAAPGDDGWHVAVPFAVRIVPDPAVRTVSFVQSSASASAETRVAPSPLVLAADPPAMTCPGGAVEVTLRITNAGEEVAEGVRLRVDLPEGLTHPHGRALEQPLEPLAPGETRAVRLVVTADGAGEYPIDARLAVGESEGLPVEVLLRCAATAPPSSVPRPGGVSHPAQSPSWCDCVP
ncbi:MAG: NEW3 domain-containing protein [Planctomycetaceae bacterium]